jgi:hypothetical protein
VRLKGCVGVVAIRELHVLCLHNLTKGVSSWAYKVSSEVVPTPFIWIALFIRIPFVVDVPSPTTVAMSSAAAAMYFSADALSALRYLFGVVCSGL